MEDKILTISKKLGLTHIGSNLSCLPILEEIYKVKKPEDKVILDNGHAHLAHLVVRNQYKPDEEKFDEKDLVEWYGIHCDRGAGCDASGGSLGHGLGIGIGYALANPDIKVYVIVSDGSMMEGSNWEALRLINQLDIKNVEIHMNHNGYTAVAPVSFNFMKAINAMGVKWTWHNTSNTKEFDGVQGHYKKI